MPPKLPVRRRPTVRNESSTPRSSTRSTSRRGKRSTKRKRRTNRAKCSGMGPKSISARSTEPISDIWLIFRIRQTVSWSKRASHRTDSKRVRSACAPIRRGNSHEGSINLTGQQREELVQFVSDFPRTENLATNWTNYTKRVSPPGREKFRGIRGIRGEFFGRAVVQGRPYVLSVSSSIRSTNRKPVGATLHGRPSLHLRLLHFIRQNRHWSLVIRKRPESEQHFGKRHPHDPPEA